MIRDVARITSYNVCYTKLLRHFDGYLTNVPPLMWGEDVLPGRVQGNALHETALFHPESKTLLVADLFVNVRAPRGLLAGLYLRFGGIKDAPGPHRFVRRNNFV